ncbi:MAG: DUF167 domain-containing protein [Desulfonatronovibrionaceae bacterium]
MDFVTRKDKTTWYVHLYVQPGAKKTEVAGEYRDALKLRVQAPPVGNKANTAVSRFLASRLGLKKSAVSISRGRRAREKTFMIESEYEPDWSGLFYD